MKEKSVLVGMSGGIDSTAVCKMLLSEGWRVVGLTIITCDASLAAADDASQLASQLGIEHHIADVREEFRKTVVQPFIDSYLAGETPNPCVVCNPTVKFRLLAEYADRLGCEKIATGHYVRLSREDDKVYICTGDDDRKDQSYFLWALPQEYLERLVLPLGEWEKSDVRRYLNVEGFEKKSKEGESMEICFINGDYRDFLRHNVPNADEVFRPGKFVDPEGRVIGEHSGSPNYTIGQRKGLGVALGYPAYVIKINTAKNTVMLGEEQLLRTRYMLINTPQWVAGAPTEGLTVRIRYRSGRIGCTTPVQVSDGRFLVELNEEASAITPGQSAVFYVGDKVVGGAFIASQRGINQWIGQ